MLFSDYLQIDRTDKTPIICLFSMAAISGLAVYAGDSTLASSIVKQFLRYMLYICSAIFLFYTIKRNIKATLSGVLLINVVVYWLISVFNTRYVEDSSLNTLFLLVFIPFALCPDRVKIGAYKLYIIYLTVMSICGLIVVVSFFIYPILPFQIVPYYSDFTEAYYYNYNIGYLFVDFNDGIRLCGLFNEPGYLGTILSLALITEKLDIKKPHVIIMLLAGFFTLSMAYFLTLFVYIILRKKNFACIGILAALFVVAIIVMPNIHFENPMIEAFVRRFDFIDGNFVGNNRNRVEVNFLLNDFHVNDNILWGRGVGATRGLGVSLIMKIVELGYLGVFLTYGLLIIVAIKYTNKKWESLIFVLCFVINIYQRTNIFTINYFLLLFGGILLISEKKNIIPQ